VDAKKTHINKARKILDFLQQADNFLLSAHLNADGDAIASVIAFNLLLNAIGKKSRMILHDQSFDSRFSYLKNFNKIESYNSRIQGNFEAAVILDVPGLNRLGDVLNLLPDPSKIVKIDHHPSEDDFAFLTMVDEHASSTTQLIYEIIDQSQIRIDRPMAQAIYTGIVYDTGRFSFSNTTARDMYICGKMIDLGVDPAYINNCIFFENSFQALRIIGEGLANMESHLDGDVNVIYLSYREMNNGHQGEIEELANYSVAIRGGQVGLFIREIQPGFHKVSFRSKGKVDVNQVAKKFSGGGHTRAAGCRIEGKKDTIIKEILTEIKKQL
jgi:phosphoesterase RecJ-like protein